jgi:hypothetical protein
MDRHLIDRWTDNTAFGVVLIFSSVLVLPVLALGLVISIGMVAAAAFGGTAVLEGAVIVALSFGGAIGLFGWLRAHLKHRTGEGNPTATILCLVIGTATALAVSAIVTVPVVDAVRAPWGGLEDVWPALPFIGANAVWAVCGIAWIQRLMHRYAQRTGRAFDGMPVVMVSVALALATSAALITTGL